MSCNLVVERVDSCLNSGLEFFACGPVSLWLVAKAGDAIAEKSGDAWEATKEGSAKAWDKTKEVSGNAWDATKEGTAKAGDAIAEKYGDAWEATKEGSEKAWDKTEGSKRQCLGENKRRRSKSQGGRYRKLS